MKNTTRQIMIPVILLGGALLNFGCRAPTTSVGATSRSDRVVFSVSSPIPTTVRVELRQDGARIHHQNTTPFRVVFPAASVREVSLRKPVEAAGVEISIRAAGAEPCRFVMESGISGVKLWCDGHRWEGRSL